MRSSRAGHGGSSGFSKRPTLADLGAAAARRLKIVVTPWFISPAAVTFANHSRAAWRHVRTDGQRFLHIQWRNTRSERIACLTLFLDSRPRRRRPTHEHQHEEMRWPGANLPTEGGDKTASESRAHLCPHPRQEALEHPRPLRICASDERA
jgi:hypothetical protein